MKATVYDLTGNRKGEVTLPKLFNSPIRKDLVMRAVEVLRIRQPHSLDPEAGKKHSAAGTISHKRHDWKGHYGKGMSRIPRKIMWRRGVQFNWVGAEVSGTRGGRRIHGPKLIRRIKHMNSKEMRLALHSALAATTQLHYLKQRYERLSTEGIVSPIILSLTHSPKAKEWNVFTEKVFGNMSSLVQRIRETRAGKGKIRNRRSKTTAGALVVIGSHENIKLGGAQVVSVKDLAVTHLYPLGRIVIYTEKALEELK